MPVTVTISGDTGTEVLDLMRDFVGEKPTVREVAGIERPKNALRSTQAEELAKQDTAPSSVGVKTSAPESPASVGSGPTATSDAFLSEPELDSAGIPFDPELHTGTKKKDGTWRVKKGMAEAAAAAAAGEAQGMSESADDAGTESVLAADAALDDDEFSAFREAAAESDNTSTPEVPVRSWTDADLGALCNQAAMKLDNPQPVKDIIAEFVPEGEVAHSRNIPADRREEFAQAVEAKAEIEFAG